MATHDRLLEPTIYDWNYTIGDLWISRTEESLWMLIDNTENNAVWKEIKWKD